MVSISPTQVTLQPSKNTTFTAVVTDTSSSAITWSVEELGTRSISQTDVYIATATEGTYHVIADSSADSSEQARVNSIFVH